MYGFAPPSSPPAPSPADVLTATEDAVTTWLETATPFAMATMCQQLSVRGMTNEKALRIRQQAWRRVGT